MQVIMHKGHTLEEAAAVLEDERTRWHKDRLARRFSTRGPGLQNTVCGFCNARISRSWRS